jgi:hypothetical protein
MSWKFHLFATLVMKNIRTNRVGPLTDRRMKKWYS